MPSAASFAFVLTPLALVAAPVVSSDYGRIPAYFERNAGQAPPDTLFIARGAEHSLALKRCGATLSLGSVRIGIELLHASRGAAVGAEEPLEGRTNYYIGRDPKRWISGVPQFGRIRYAGVYPGIDVVWHASGQQLEYDLVVKPSGDPGRVAFRLTGAAKPVLTPEGDLVLRTAEGEIRQRRPVIYQEEANGARVPVEGRYELRPSGEVRIRAAAYEHRKPLVLDPVLTWATYVSSTGNTSVNGLAVDSTGAAYLVGNTYANTFPGFPGPSLANGFYDAFVAKVNPQGTGLAYVTYLGTGGMSESGGLAIAVDASGNAYVTGIGGLDFPVTPGAAQMTIGPAGPAVIVKLDPSGQIVYSTLLGGSESQGGGQPYSVSQSGLAIAVDSTGAAYVAGTTYAIDFPVTPNAYLTANPSGNWTSFVTKVNPAGSAWVYSTYLGGNWADQANAIAVNAAGEAWVAGNAASSNFPVTPDALHSAPSGGFVSRLSADGGSLLYSTYLDGVDEVFAAALDSSGNVYVGGEGETSFPTTPGAYQTQGPGGFLAKISADGKTAIYSTFLGPGYVNPRGIAGIAIDSSGQAVVAGSTLVPFPTTPGALQTGATVATGSLIGALAVLSPDGSTLRYSTLIGYTGASLGGLALDAQGNAYVAGITNEPQVTTPNAYQTVSPAANPFFTSSTFLEKINLADPTICTIAFSPSSINVPDSGGTGTLTITVPPGCPWQIGDPSNLVTFTGTTGSPTTGTVQYSIVPNWDLGPRSVTLNVGAGSLTVSQAAVSCSTPLILPDAFTFDASGGSQTLSVDIPPNCTWTVSSPQPWATITNTSGWSGFTVSVDQNSFAQRTATLEIAGVAVPLTQASGGCTATVVGPSGPLPATGAAGNLYIATSDPSCRWFIYGIPAWMRIGSVPAAGQGDAVLSFVVPPNPVPAAQSATLLVAGQSVAVTQSAGPVGLPGSYVKTLFAGSGTYGPLGDGGPATSAWINNASALAWRDGNLYIADSSDHVVRVVTPDGIINTIAGGGTASMNGPPTGVNLGNPDALAFGADGTMFVADSANNHVWGIPPGGSAAVIAGGLAPGDTFTEPTGLAVDASGAVYVSDLGGNRIRKVIPGVTPVETTIAGTGACEFSGDNGPASAATLCLPQGLVFDSSGNLYVADTTYRVRKISNGVISTVAGGGSNAPADGLPATSVNLGPPYQLASDPQGDLFMTAQTGVFRVTPDQRIFSLVPSFVPQGIAVDNLSNVYYSERFQVWKLSPLPDFCSSLVTPGAPSAPAPADAAAGVVPNPILSWAGTGGAVSYDVYFGVSDPPAFAGNVTCTNYSVPGLAANTTYFWQVVPKGVAAAASPVWSFTTQGGQVSLALNIVGSGTVVAAPSSPDQVYPSRTKVCLTATPAPGAQFLAWSGAALDASNCLVLTSYVSVTATFASAVPPAVLTAPANGAIGVTLTPTLTWTGSADATFFDVYFGTQASPPLVANVTASSYSPGTLDPGSLYFWRVVAKDSSATNSSPTWSFTTPMPSQPPAALRFVPVSPSRIVDTRFPAGPFAGPTMAAGDQRAFAIPQAACAIPSTAQAYSLNVTVVPQGPLQYLTLWPSGQPQPLVSTLNSWGGIVVANAAIVPAGAGGGVSVYVTDPSDVILDINGYFDTSTGATSYSFYPATPCRVADTRNAAGTFGGPTMQGNTSRDFPIPLSSCDIPATARAYSLNATVVPQGALGYLSTWPTGQQQPLVSTLNSPAGKIVANAAIVPAGTNESISVYVTNTTDVILDVNGSFGQPGSPHALSFYPVTPCRIADTRNAAGAFGGPIMGAGQTRSFTIPASACNIPAAAAAYSLNVTVVPEGPLNYLSAWPAGASQPLVSTLNSNDGSVLANAAIVPAGSNGAIDIFVTNQTHVILDINGYFAP